MDAIITARKNLIKVLKKQRVDVQEQFAHDEVGIEFADIRVMTEEEVVKKVVSYVTTLDSEEELYTLDKMYSR